jgi:hypothetical protein
MVQMDTFGKSREQYDTHTRFYALLCIHLFIMIDSILQKASTGVDSYFIDVWVPMHRDDLEATQKLVSNNFSTYVCIVYFILVINNFTFV